MKAKPSKVDRGEKFEQNDIQDRRETLSAALAEASSLLDDAEFIDIITASDSPENTRTEALPETYWEEECSSSWFVIETLVEEVGDILRSHGHHTAAACLRSAYLDFSCSSAFAMEELREPTHESRDEIDLDYIQGSCLEDMQRDARSDDRMLRLLLDGMNSKSEDVEKKRAKAIEYTFGRLSRSVRGIVYHTCRGND